MLRFYFNNNPIGFYNNPDSLSSVVVALDKIFNQPLLLQFKFFDDIFTGTPEASYIKDGNFPITILIPNDIPQIIKYTLNDLKEISRKKFNNVHIYHLTELPEIRVDITIIKTLFTEKRLFPNNLMIDLGDIK